MVSERTILNRVLFVETNQQSESSKARTDGETDMPSYVDMMKTGAVQKVGFIITSPKQSKHGTGG